MVAGRAVVEKQDHDAQTVLSAGVTLHTGTFKNQGGPGSCPMLGTNHASAVLGRNPRNANLSRWFGTRAHGREILPSIADAVTWLRAQPE